MESRKQPEVRFVGYTDDWEQRKLGRYVNIRSGWSPSDFEVNNRADNLFIKVDDLNYSNRVQSDSNMKVNIHPKYQKMKKGSTLFPKRGAAIMTNKIRILGKDSYMDTNMMALEPDGIDAEFLYTFISRTGLYKIADTSTIPQINNKHIEPYEISLPDLNEQVKIGKFFKQLDYTIALHQRKLELLKEQKKAFLQKMFPKAGANTPEVRFAGFTDDWKERKLGEISNLSSSKRIHLSDYVENGIPFYRGSEISSGGIVGTQELFISRKLYQQIKEKYGVPKENDLLITAVGTLGNIWKVDNRKFYYKDGNLIRISDLEAETDYIFTYLNDGIGKDRLINSAAGSNQKALTMAKMNLVDVSLPSKEEQQKIGSFFKQLDDTIALNQKELDLLKETKKGFLQKMFV